VTAAALPLTDPASGRPLQVLITRPSGQAEETASLVEALGGAALVAPCLRLAPPADSPGTRGALFSMPRTTLRPRFTQSTSSRRLPLPMSTGFSR
jgi:hypothetical protein